MKQVGRKINQLLDDLRHRRCGRKRKLEIEKSGNDSISYEHKEEMRYLPRVHWPANK